MRVIPLLTAICVLILLYVAVFERNDLIRLVRGQNVTFEDLTDGLNKKEQDGHPAQNPPTIQEQKQGERKKFVH